ncbi:MAG: hypothetical protein ACI9AQ_001839 [Dinoroseobacter sp.]|jgi:hypothetical protein
MPPDHVQRHAAFIHEVLKLIQLSGQHDRPQAEGTCTACNSISMIIIVVIGAFAAIIVLIMIMIVGMPVMMINVIKCTIALTLSGAGRASS